MARHISPPVVALACGVAALGVALAAGQRELTPSQLRNHPAIAYQETAPSDPIAQLNERLRNGGARLDFDPEAGGYLRSVLSALQVPIESQVLVFSKTSFQARLINPSNPRALYFNDAVSVGFVRGGEVLEFIAQDPRQGAIFYTLDQKPAATPQFTRNLSTCVQCHTGDTTVNVPGWFLSSVFPDPEGTVLFSPVFSTDHRTMFENRWGGWYVTGRHRIPRHLGNATVGPGMLNEEMVTPATVGTTTLEGRFDPAGYPTTGSDIVALMVLEHQAHMLNLVTRLGWEWRIEIADAAMSDSALQTAARQRRDALVGELVDYMLFVDEALLPSPIAGTSDFASTFAARGPRDSKGRSLRDLDLQTRLMRYPCSFVIYSEPFAALPDAAREAVYARLYEVLSGEADEPRYKRLAPSDRQAILEILRDTKSDLPPYFHDGPSSSAP